MEHVHQGIQDKLTAFEQILRQEGLGVAEAAFVGDDVIDLPVMRACGFAVAVANAREEVKAEAHFITLHAGGEGAAPDAIEFILKAQGKWERVVSDYICERGAKKIRCYKPALKPHSKSYAGGRISFHAYFVCKSSAQRGKRREQTLRQA